MKGARREAKAKATSSSPSPHGAGGVDPASLPKSKEGLRGAGGKEGKRPSLYTRPPLSFWAPPSPPPSFSDLPSEDSPPIHPRSSSFSALSSAWRSVLLAACSRGNSVNSPLAEGIEVGRVLGGQSAAEGWGCGGERNLSGCNSSRGQN